jgi:hypothetical protein
LCRVLELIDPQCRAGLRHTGKAVVGLVSRQLLDHSQHRLRVGLARLRLDLAAPAIPRLQEPLGDHASERRDYWTVTSLRPRP